jgi:NAD(P)-dependent dehydrogenase (short-subunit alcohol dehydrogenase family)
MTLTAGLSGKAALVTGVGSSGSVTGIGEATAVALAREGVRVGLVNRHLERAETVRARIADDGGAAIAIAADVADEAACAEAVARVVEAYGGIDILVNVVGIEGAMGDVTTVDAEEFDRAMRVNLTSMVLTSKYAVPAMVADGGGAIVNISSVAGSYAGLPSVLYPSSKAAVDMLTRSMAAHHGGQGIRVNAVAPGMVFGPRLEAAGLTEAGRAARRQATMLGTEGTAWDIADAVVFLASERARWITGVVLPVDAGLTAKIPITNPAYDDDAVAVAAEAR